MIRVCCVCKKVYGIKRPLLRLRKTHGICDDCRPGELRRISREVDRLEALRKEPAYAKSL